MSEETKSPTVSIGGFTFSSTPPEELSGFNFGVQGPGDSEETQDDVAPEPSLLTVANRTRRTTVSAEVYSEQERNEEFCPTKFDKSEDDSKALIQVLEPHSLFRHLDDRELSNLVELMQPKHYKAGSSLSDDSTPDSSLLHIILEGTCEVKSSDGKVIRTLGPHDTCGEMEMMYTQAHTQVITAVTDVKSFCINRPTYQRTLQSTFAKKRALYCEFLKNVKFLEGLSRAQMVQLADCLEGQKFVKDDVLIPYHAPPDAMYIIMDGVVKVVGRDDGNKNIDVCEFTRGAIVGEMEFLNNHDNVADVIAKSDEVRVARLERKHFELCMGPVKDLLLHDRQVDPVYAYYNKKRAQSMSDLPKDPEKGFVLEVYANRQAYTYAGQVKTMMREGENRVTLTGVGRAAEVVVTTANRLRDAQLVTFHRIGTYVSARGGAGIHIVLDKAADFAAHLPEKDAKEDPADPTDPAE